jgi:hypothetical protein
MRTRWFPALVVALAVLAGRGAAQPEWVSLFDGTSIAHWRGFKMATVPDGWQVVDGAITRVGAGADLVSREQYRDFEFEFEWKLPPGGNSGVMFRVTEDLERTYHSGPEFQILDNALHADGRNPLTSVGANYALHAPTRDASRPVGEWNQGRLVVNGTHVQHWLNGEKVVDYRLGTAEWAALVKASKFNEWPRYGREPQGYIVIQDHGDRVQFRNLRIRRLS